MEETLKIQEEFELLIRQLERLKTANEITTANAESAKKVIVHMDSFVRESNDFQQKVVADLESKSNAVASVITNLEKAITVYRSALTNQQAENKKWIDDLNIMFQKDIAARLDSLNSNTEKTLDEVGRISKSIEALTNRLAELDDCNKTRFDLLNQRNSKNLLIIGVLVGVSCSLAIGILLKLSL